MKETLIVISTFRKELALKELLTTLKQFGYFDEADILVTDDAAEEEENAKWVLTEFGPILYTGGKRLGIAGQKNRGIRYFLMNPQYKYLLLLDDDLVVHAPGLIQACINTGKPHLTGYLGQWEEGVGVMGYDIRPQLSGNPFFKDFPIEGQTEDGEVVYCFGSQGGMLFFTREILEKAQYFHIPPGKYGYEHSIFSNVINKILGVYISWFPILWNSPKYFRDNGKYPNRYEAAPEIAKNNLWWAQKKIDIDKGINYINKVHGIPETEEIIRCEEKR